MEWDIDNRVMNQMAFEERVSRALPTQNCVVSGFPLFSVILLLGHSSNQATSCSFLRGRPCLIGERLFYNPVPQNGIWKSLKVLGEQG